MTSDTFTIILASIFGLLLVSMAVLGIVCAEYGVTKFSQLYKGCIGDAEFDVLLLQVFNSKDLTYDGFSYKTKEYDIWAANGCYGFKINGVKDFSVSQKRKFLKIHKKLKAQREFVDTDTALNIKQLKVLASKNAKLLYGKE